MPRTLRSRGLPNRNASSVNRNSTHATTATGGEQQPDEDDPNPSLTEQRILKLLSTCNEEYSQLEQEESQLLEVLRKLQGEEKALEAAMKCTQPQQPQSTNNLKRKKPPPSTAAPAAAASKKHPKKSTAIARLEKALMEDDGSDDDDDSSI